jgi:predicted translin family RNA/ssDNA-binding protein
MHPTVRVRPPFPSPPPPSSGLPVSLRLATSRCRSLLPRSRDGPPRLARRRAGPVRRLPRRARRAQRPARAHHQGPPPGTPAPQRSKSDVAALPGVSQASRDITNASKKTIFLLHRVAAEDADGDGSSSAAAAAEDKLAEIRRLFAGLREDLQGARFWRYRQNIAGGLQEYIEALGLAHYFARGSLISYDAVQRTLSAEDGANVGSQSDRALTMRSSCCPSFFLSLQYLPLPVDDYLLGLSDLTGELMRYAISTIARKGGRARALQVCSFVRATKAGEHSALRLSLLPLPMPSQPSTSRPADPVRAPQTLSRSPRSSGSCARSSASRPARCRRSKTVSPPRAFSARRLPCSSATTVAAYAITVRTAEYDLPQEMLDEIVSRCVAGVGADSRHDDMHDDGDD